ncbi:MAG: hypothetical protein ACK4RS_04675 [Thiothrix sp.]
MIDHASPNELWPPASYYQQVTALQALVGQSVYVVEVTTTDMNAGVRFPGQAVELLAVVDFPKPDPYRQLCPHLLILGDGRGVNLGRVARVTCKRAFAPNAADVVFSNHELVEGILFAPRTLNREFVAATTRAALGSMLGTHPQELLANITDAIDTFPSLKEGDSYGIQQDS